MTEKIPEPKDTAPTESASTPMPSRYAPSVDYPYTTDPQNPTHKQHTQTNSSYQNYLFGGAGSADAPAWSDSAKGRFAIRAISRGIVGAAFFTIGGRMASRHLEGYNQTKAWDRSKPLQAIAKGIDLTLGKGIQKTVEGLAGFKYGFGSTAAKSVGKRAVTFRTTREYKGSGFEKGRSYGADIVGFTFDFAMASIGDAGTRSIIQAFDPNVKKSWKVNDKGEMAAKGEHWHFLPGAWLKAVGKTTWRVFSKNQGEDWAAAIPYAFQMKFQRQFLSNVLGKRWDGHKVVFDRSWNGGAYKVNAQGKVIGDYQLVGAIDLHARFVGYNWYTLMFREGYDAISNKLTKWKEDGFSIHTPKLPEHFNPITSTMDSVGHAARYVTKSFIKANMYMTPAVIPFWLMRVPQSKWRADHFIMNGEKTPIPSDFKPFEGGPFSGNHYDYPATGMDRAEKIFSRALHPFGWVSHKAGDGAVWVGEKAFSKGYWPKTEWFNKLFKNKTPTHFTYDRQSFMREYVDASLSYTPYMWAKAETGLRVDDGAGKGDPGQMDLAIYKFMDDVASFKFKEIPEDLKKMWKLGTNFERDVKMREGSGHSDTQEITKAPATPTTPITTVQTSSLTRYEPTQLARADAPSANAPHDTWTKMVAGSDIAPSRIHTASSTRQ